MPRLFYIAAQFVLGIVLALLFMPTFEVTMWMLPDIGWHFLTIIYIIILLFQILFYFFTSNQKPGWAVLSFFINFVFWSVELAVLESNFENSFMFKGGVDSIWVCILAGALWVSNKALIDWVFITVIGIESKNSILNKMLVKN